MFYTIYKTTNLVNGKFYIGKHQTENIYDNYFGSGKLIKESIKKYGKSSFRKEILFVFETEEEMNNKEKELITIDLVLNDDCYNMTVGGEGGPHFKDKNHSKESREKISKSSKNKVLSEQTKEKISKNNRGEKRFHSEKTKVLISKAQKERGRTKEEKEKTSLSHKKYWSSLTEEEKEKRISNCYGENSPQYGTMWITNIELKENKKISKHDKIPEGWIKGRKIKWV